MTLPLSRDKTHTDGTPIDPATIDRLQDGLIAKKHGELWIPVDAFEWTMQDPTDFTVVQATSANSRGNHYGAVAVGYLHWAPRFPEGTVIKEITIYTEDDGANEWSLASVEADWSGSANTAFLDDVEASVGTGFKQTNFNAANMPNTLPYTLTGSKRFSFRVATPTTTPSSGDRFFGARVLIYKP